MLKESFGDVKKVLWANAKIPSGSLWTNPAFSMYGLLARLAFSSLHCSLADRHFIQNGPDDLFGSDVVCFGFVVKNNAMVHNVGSDFLYVFG